MLDLYCYVGAFANYAAQAGATSVLGVDASPLAIELAARNATTNGLAAQCSYVRPAHPLP